MAIAPKALDLQLILPGEDEPASQEDSTHEIYEFIRGGDQVQEIHASVVRKGSVDLYRKEDAGQWRSVCHKDRGMNDSLIVCTYRSISARTID